MMDLQGRSLWPILGVAMLSLLSLRNDPSFVLIFNVPIAVLLDVTNVTTLETVSVTSRSALPSDIAESRQEPCRVVVENRADYHYEILESTILLYPLPWNSTSIKCNFTWDGREKPLVIFDVALVDPHLSLKNEKEGWVEYFAQYLSGKIRDRADGVTRAQFGEVVRYTNYTRHYHGYIGASCNSIKFVRWLRSDKRNFCVLHAKCEARRCGPRIMDRSCWLSPMHSPNCFFLPTAFPQFHNETPEQTNSNENKPIKVCVSGRGRHHDLLADTLAVLSNQTRSVAMYPASGHERRRDFQVSIFQRTKNIPGAYIIRNVSQKINVVRESKILDFQRSMSRCDLLLPLIEPETQPKYFGVGDRGLKKLTGTLPQAIGYSIPTVLHSALHAIYRQHLTAPSWTYSDMQTFIVAFEKALVSLDT